MRVCAVLLSLAVLLLLSCAFADADNFYLYARLDTSKFTWAGSGTGQWSDSTYACGSNASGSCYLHSSSFTVTPTFGVAGGFYEVFVVHATGSYSVSSGLLTNCSVSSGGTGVTGDLYTPGYTNQWAGSTACSNYSIGIIKLNASTTTATLSFWYNSGTLTSSHRWDVQGLYLPTEDRCLPPDIVRDQRECHPVRARLLYLRNIRDGQRNPEHRLHV